MPEAGDVVLIDFPGVQGVKRRPTVVLSSSTYHAVRPDLIVGLITSQLSASIGPTDYALVNWAQAGLRVPCAFRSFLATLPPSARPMVIGRLSPQDWQEVCARVKVAITPLDAPPAAP